MFAAARSKCQFFHRYLQYSFQPMSFFIPVNEFGWRVPAVERAAQLVLEGKVIALPTDTVYGVAVAAQNTQAVKELYKIKGRDRKKPVAICVNDVKSISCWGKLDGLPPGLLDALLPGPVTVVLERTSDLNPTLNSDTSKVGIRIPNSEFVLQLCKRLGTPLALTSANASNEPSSLAPEEFQSLWPHLAAVFHCGRIGDSSSSRAGSTVVDLSVPGKYHIVRPGSALASTKGVLEHFEIANVTSFNGREDLVKQYLISQLSSSVKEIQLEAAQTQVSTDITASFCTVLEAIFIHGLKDTFMNRVSQAIGSDPDQRPEPSYWGPLLIFSHREIIDQISALNLVTTDIGRCRAWLRLALNDGLLSSYLESMRRDGSALKPYYRRSAFLRDTEILDVAKGLVEGIESCQFSVACNSSLLNVWTNSPLLLAGLWTPPLRSCPVASGVDVASTLDSGDAGDSLSSAVSLSSHSYEGSGLGTVFALNEDEALKIILGTPVHEAPLLNPKLLSENAAIMQGNIGNSSSDIIAGGSNYNEGTDIPVRNDDMFGDDDGPSSVGNSLVGRAGWSSSFEDVPESSNGGQLQPEEVECIPSVSRKSASVTKSKTPFLKSPSEIQSYHSLLESYNLLTGSNMKTPDLRDFLQRFEGTETATDSTPIAEAEDPFSSLYGLGFEVVPTSPTVDIPEFRSLVQQLGKLATEPGLDNQNYTCKGCGHPIGMNFGKAKVCSFIGGYFCSECHVGQEWVIPARVIHNMDFRRYPVARRSAAFLEEIQHRPLLDLKSLNPRLYLAVEDMTQLQTLRIQLNLLRAYLFTCREPVIEELQKRVWPREHLYEHVHLYSVADLLQIPSGTLVHFLQKVVAFAKEHVLSCWLCCQKGFICEVCNNPKVIYPFDMESTYRCGVCSAVFHVGCLNATKPCPKCERRQKREDLSLLEGDS